jgi:UDP-glucuronate 4-epimerase
MAAYLFTRAILAGEPVKVFNEGRMARDFTYIDDIVAGILAAVDRPAMPGEHRLYNLGNHRPERLLDFIHVLEQLLGRTALKHFLPMQPGDVPMSYADIGPARRDLGFEPKTTIQTGLAAFIEWYVQYHCIVVESTQQ